MAIETSVHRLSTEEYERIVDTRVLADQRVELLDGLLVDMSPQGARHAWVIRQFIRLFAGHSELLHVQLPLAVAEGWMPEPDVALVERYEGERDRHPTTALLVAEVAVSSQSVDWRKARAYASAGVPQYWLVDVPAGIVHVHTDPGPDGYATVVACRDDDVLDAAVEGVDQTTVAALLDL